MWLFILFTATVVKATDFVTCGSVIKLVNKAYTVRLHSHEVSLLFVLVRTVINHLELGDVRIGQWSTISHWFSP